MAIFIHVVGQQGVGKSTVIVALAAHYAARGNVCAGQDPDIFDCRAMALTQVPGADVYFIEYQDERAVDALPGELVIRLDRAQIRPELATAASTQPEGAAHA